MSKYNPAHRAIANRPFITLCRYCAPYWRAYTAAIFCGIVFLASSLAMPLIFREIIKAFDETSIAPELLWNSFYVLVLITLMTAVSRFFQRYFIGRASRKFEYQLRDDYFRHIQGLSQDFFHRTQTGDIMARATNDLNFVREFIGAGFMGIVDLLRIPFSLLVLLHISIEITIAVTLAVPIASALTYYILRVTRRKAHIVQDLFSEITSIAQENLAGARVVKAYDISDRQVEAFNEKSEIYARENLIFVAIKSSISPMMTLLIRTSIIITLVMGVFMVLENDTTMRVVIEDGWLAIRSEPFTRADLMGFLVCLLMVSGSISAFALITIIYQQGAAGMNRIAELMAETPSIDDTEETDFSIDSLKGEIRFDNVSFDYNDTPVLRDISWSCKPGQTVAIVGHTGSGKSTMMSLITRLYDPESGTILLDDVDARTIPLNSLRTSIGVVPQDTFLFSTSIRDNLTIGRPDATEQQIMEACRIAQFDEALAGMKDGLDTLLGERGINLSGGQKQRLTIARALIQDPAILLLDDALSSVDTRTEEQILRGLKEFMSTRTSVVISHRVSTVQHADIILVLDEGHICERGTHSELVAQDGIYGEMYKRQLLEDELEDQ